MHNFCIVILSKKYLLRHLSHHWLCFTFDLIHKQVLQREVLYKTSETTGGVVWVGKDNICKRLLIMHAIYGNTADEFATLLTRSKSLKSVTCSLPDNDS